MSKPALSTCGSACTHQAGQACQLASGGPRGCAHGRAADTVTLQVVEVEELKQTITDKLGCGPNFKARALLGAAAAPGGGHAQPARSRWPVPTAAAALPALDARRCTLRPVGVRAVLLPA